jgi:hypothetical protein
VAPSAAAGYQAARSNESFEAMADASKQPYDKHHEDPAHREQRIRERAHRMWESDGCPEGMEDQYWNRAQELIEDENQSAYPPSASRGNRT